MSIKMKPLKQHLI